ncbi:MAG: RNA polymerase sigma factor [Christensenellales bacterium]|jgi:RNA polymerase sigma factor (sigma-70 family)
MNEEKQFAADPKPAFEEQIALYEQRIYNVCLRMMRHPQDAMDMTQETFLKAWRAWSGFRGQSAVGTWLHRVAVNTCLDELRRRKKIRRVSLQELQESGWEPSDEEALNVAARLADKELVREALQRLRADHRTVIVLRDMEGYSYDEIALLLRCPVGTVRSRLSRGRSELMKILGSAEQNQDNFVQTGKGGTAK